MADSNMIVKIEVDDKMLKSITKKFEEVLETMASLEKRVEELEKFYEEDEECLCHRCIKEKKITFQTGMRSIVLSEMILCPICGNKRCPKASDHRLECTGSNEPGQEGSIYEQKR